MADKPSRALVVFGDGLAPSIGSEHTHLHSFASRGLCGFLSLPNAPPSGSSSSSSASHFHLASSAPYKYQKLQLPIALASWFRNLGCPMKDATLSHETEDERIVREFALLIDALDTYLILGDERSQDKPSYSTIPERFKGMRAALFADHPSLVSFAAKLGINVIGLSKGSNAVLSYFGLMRGSTLDTHFDVVFVHAGAGEKLDSDMECVNNFVGDILKEAHRRPEIGSCLHLSVVMSYGKFPAGSDTHFSVLSHKYEENSNLSKLIPRQSYTLRGEDPRDNVRHHHPMLVAQWQNAVTRRDAVETFSFEDFKERGANLVIPADRFLHEIAFKLWKAPKYGA